MGDEVVRVMFAWRKMKRKEERKRSEKQYLSPTPKQAFVPSLSICDDPRCWRIRVEHY